MTNHLPVPIGDYGLIGDTRTAALVAPSGAIDWCCVPRFDAPPLFGRLVGGAGAGHFSLGPARASAVVARRYRAGTTTLETEWSTPTGVLSVADSMIGEVSGALLPQTMLVRRISAASDPVQVRLRFAPRFGYHRDRPSRVRSCAGALVVEHGDLVVSITTDADCTLLVDDEVTFTVQPSRPATIALSATHRGPAILVPPALAADEAARDERGWRSWADGIQVASDHRDVMVRSLLTLQLLTYSPSGAPVAAPTTSLPERIGGPRNWDYRYAWPRDASIGIAAFLAVGKTREALSFLAWLRHAGRLARPKLPPLFTLDGRPGPSETTLDSWRGYAESTPVRVGNGASDQHQLDGYGWVLDAAWLLTEAGERLDGETWRTMRAFADRVTHTWREPDAGIWERRDAPRHHVHSKLMAWLALDRAARIAERRGRAEASATRWRSERDAIGDDVRRRGFNDDIGAYTAAYGSTEVDAAVLVLPLLGIEPVGSQRVRSTIDAIASRLDAGGPLLYRYLDADGLPGREGAFLPCSFWHVQALARTGRVEEAEGRFHDLLALAGPLGLFAEEIEPGTRAHLGNFPQALTHATLLQAALALQSALASAVRAP